MPIVKKRELVHARRSKDIFSTARYLMGFLSFMGFMNCMILLQR